MRDPRLSSLFTEASIPVTLRRSPGPDTPFTPHVTVAALEDPEQAAAVADELNASGVAIAGTIFAIDVLELDGKAVREILRIELRR